MNEPIYAPQRATTGTAGMDRLLGGGLPRGRTYLVHGGPGTGKTTFGIKFLLEGLELGERVLYVTLLQTRDEVNDVLLSHGWDLGDAVLLEFPEDVRQAAATEQTLFSRAEVELNEITDAIVAAIEEHRPQRFLLDSVSELGMLIDNSYQLRQQMLRLKLHLHKVGCTALWNAASNEVDLPMLSTIVQGVIMLEKTSPFYGSTRRRLEVTKVRGIPFMGGYHDFRIQTGGLVVYPRLSAVQEANGSRWETVASGNAELDALFGGGMEQGTASLITGTTGAGKSTLASLYVQAAADRGEHSVIFCFDEGRETFLRRAKGLGMPIAKHIEAGLVTLHQVDVGQITAGEFVDMVRRSVEEQHSRIVVIDSLTGYMQSMPEDRLLTAQLHTLLSYCSAAGVLTLMIVAFHGLSHMESTLDASYIADTVVLMRHFEAAGRVRRCVSVLKKRHGNHETTIREVQMGPGGVRVGQPLSEFSGLLSGNPRYEGAQQHLMTGETPPDEGRP